ncbi:sushi domain-containing protein 3 [Xiphophorus hellerii]|uniref:sushi domain-containing protein 3 n=1 Tax=Xiphophorus hellerii TaxID=8084 RepID=UPI0013B45B6F|nr:sushi domain-containing protein 3-like [Xiphophorus hellerii]
MSAATASVADVRLENKEDIRTRSKPGRQQAQCTPRPLPAVGTHRIIQGNGTDVGTVISLQCPAKHKLVGKELKCVMVTNSTQWMGETFCQPVAPYEDYGFRVAVLASIISSGIILLMSVAFITCCLLECTEEDKHKKQRREGDDLPWEGQDQHREDSRSPYSHKGQNNNNNNNAEEKMLPLWEPVNSAPCNTIPCRCQQQYTHGPLPLSLAALPGQDYDQPLLPENPPTRPPEYPGPPLSFCPAADSRLVHFSAAGSGLVWQYGGQHCDISEVNPSVTRNTNTNGNIIPKEVSIRMISV